MSRVILGKYKFIWMGSNEPSDITIMGTSKYTGVNFHKRSNKWLAIIHLDGKQQFIGSYDNEEEAAVDYARAVFK